jgi:hypothetical protein
MEREGAKILCRKIYCGVRRGTQSATGVTEWEGRGVLAVVRRPEETPRQGCRRALLLVLRDHSHRPRVTDARHDSCESLIPHIAGSAVLVSLVVCLQVLPRPPCGRPRPFSPPPSTNIQAVALTLSLDQTRRDARHS